MDQVELSVCIVTFQARYLLRDCLFSLKENCSLKLEVIVVDNGSTDGVLQMLEQEFPGTCFIRNEYNAGYTRPMNQALLQAQGEFLLQLNPDTIILPKALETLVQFLKDHPETGICGPKVLNSDMTMQKPCRRGEPTPLAVIAYFSGLATLFPHAKLLGGYLMNYMDEDQTHPVAGVAGSCMLIRREVINQIGFLDENFFAYQEDADYCHRARQAGWQVFYVPEAQIIHFGSLGGSRVQPYRSIFEWHRSYYLYYRKHLARNYFFLFNWVYYLAMLAKLILALLVNLGRKEKYSGRKKPGTS